MAECEKLLLPKASTYDTRSEHLQVSFEDGSEFHVFGRRARGAEPPVYQEMYVTEQGDLKNPPHFGTPSQYLLTAEELTVSNNGNG